MIVLWDLAARHRGVVLGTENRTEGLLGYFTIYGDAGSAVEPIAGLFKTQVWSLSRHLGVPEQVVEKPPTADLWVGLGKCALFGTAVGLIAGYLGMNVKGGAEAVGKAANDTVVYTIVLILVVDYVVSMALLGAGL